MDVGLGKDTELRECPFIGDAAGWGGGAKGDDENERRGNEDKE